MKAILLLILSTAFLGNLPNAYADISDSEVDLSSLKADNVAADVDTQLEKIYKDVREFHIFKPMYTRWSGTDTFTTLVTGQNGFPVFSARSDKDPKYTDYPIDYTNRTIRRYQPVRPPASALDYYTSHSIALGDAKTATYNAPLVAAGTIGKGRVLVMGSHLYGSILVNPRNYSTNYSNGNKTNSPDSIDMENFFHNVMAWLTEQNSDSSKRYSKAGASTSILSNKERTMFWHIGGNTYQNDSEAFLIHDNFNLSDGENPKYTPTWQEAKDQSLLDPSVYPLLILEDFQMRSSWTHYKNETVRKTLLSDVDLIVDYIRAGGGVLIMESPSYAETAGVIQTAANEIMKKAGVTTFFANHRQSTKLLPAKTHVGGVHEYDMCLVDYIGHTDLQRRLGMDDYSNVPTTLIALKQLLTDNNKLNYLEEVLEGRERKIFIEGNSENPDLTQENCGTVEVEDANANKVQVQTTLVKGDGIVQDGGNFDKYAKYPVDLNFVQAQGDVGGSMNTLLAHELKTDLLTEVDLNREYTNMSALLLNDAVFTGEKFQSLNDLLGLYKTQNESITVNDQGEFYPGFSFSKKDILDYRRKPVTRIMVERAFYDKALKYDPSEFPGQTSSTGASDSAAVYLHRNTQHQKWYAGNMQSTGLYAPAHQDISITLPDGVDETKMQVQIGVGDNVGGIFRHEINLKRPPKYVKKYKFIASDGSSTKTITIQHPYGGLIFLKSYNSSVEVDAKVTINFSGVQKAVRFVLGKTTAEEWESLKNNAIAPKAELESHHYIVTVARANMASLSFDQVTQLAEDFDTMAQNAYDFYGYDQTCPESFTEHTPPSCDNGKKPAHKNREVFDPHISVGAGHSGYPIMVMSWNPTKTTFPQNATSSFLLWHEMGHNMVESWLGIAGATEVANNVMAMHQQQRFSKSLRASGSINAVDTILSKGQPWADGGNAGRLLMFYQLAKWIDSHYLDEFKSKNSKYYENGDIKDEYPFLDGNGFDLFKILHREARDKSDSTDKYAVCRKQSGKTKTDMLAICTAAILELNTVPFFEAWKAGTIGIGSVDGKAIYDTSGGITEGLNVNQETLPNPHIQDYKG